MRKVCGLIIFSFGAGMAFMLFFRKTILVVALIVFILLVGYNLFCNWD